MQHVPGIEPETGAHQHRHRQPVQHQTTEQLRQPTPETAGAELLHGAESGQAAAFGRRAHSPSMDRCRWSGQGHSGASGLFLAHHLAEVAPSAQDWPVIATQVTARSWPGCSGTHPSPTPVRGSRRADPDAAGRRSAGGQHSGCPASAAWPRASDSAGRRSRQRTPDCATPASSRHAAVPATSRIVWRVCPAAMVPATPGPQGVISLTFARRPRADPVAAAFGRAVERMGPLLAGPGYLPEGCLSCARGSPTGTWPAGCRPTGPDRRDLRCGGRPQRGAPDRAHHRRPGVCRVTDLPGRDGRDPAGRRSAVPWPLTEDGWDLDRLEVLLRQSAPRLAYLIPDYHNPTGRLMSGDHRVSDSAAAAPARGPAGDRRVTADLRLEGPTRPALRRERRRGRDHRIGQQGVLGWSADRLDPGSPRADPTAGRAARAILDLASPVFEQLVLADMLADPEPLLAEQRLRLLEQRDRLIADLGERLSDWRVPTPRRRARAVGRAARPSRPPGSPWPPNATAADHPRSPVLPRRRRRAPPAAAVHATGRCRRTRSRPARHRLDRSGPRPAAHLALVVADGVSPRSDLDAQLSPCCPLRRPSGPPS